MDHIRKRSLLAIKPKGIPGADITRRRCGPGARAMYAPFWALQLLRLRGWRKRKDRACNTLSLRCERNLSNGFLQTSWRVRIIGAINLKSC